MFQVRQDRVASSRTQALLVSSSSLIWVDQVIHGDKIGKQITRSCSFGLNPPRAGRTSQKCAGIQCSSVRQGPGVELPLTLIRIIPCPRDLCKVSEIISEEMVVYSGRDSGLGAGRKVQFGVHHLLSKYLLRIFVYWTAFQGAVTDQMNGGAGSAESEDRGAQWRSHSEAVMVGEGSSQ